MECKTATFYNVSEVVDFPTVGDKVEVSENPSGDSLILKVLPRKSVFKRLNATPGQPDMAVAYLSGDAARGTLCQ